LLLLVEVAAVRLCKIILTLVLVALVVLELGLLQAHQEFIQLQLVLEVQLIL
jgi:hypothetical protein